MLVRGMTAQTPEAALAEALAAIPYLNVDPKGDADEILAALPAEHRQAWQTGLALAALHTAMPPESSTLSVEINVGARVWFVSVWYGPDSIASGTNASLAAAADACRAALGASEEGRE